MIEANIRTALNFLQACDSGQLSNDQQDELVVIRLKLRLLYEQLLRESAIETK